MLAEVKANRIDVAERHQRAGGLVREYFMKYLPLHRGDSTGSDTPLMDKTYDNPYQLERIRIRQYSSQKPGQERTLVTCIAGQRELAAAVEVHKKYSIPVACIVFVLIGAPLASWPDAAVWQSPAASPFYFSCSIGDL